MAPPSNPTSVPSRALRYLESLPSGAEISNAKLAEAIGSDPSGMHAGLAAHVKSGLVIRRQKGGHPRSPIFWSLPPEDDGKPVRRVVAAKDAPPLGVKAAIWPPTAAPVDAPIIASQQWPTPTYEGTLPEVKLVRSDPATWPMEARRVVMPPAEATADPLHLRAALWSDGSLELRRGSKQIALLLPEETADLVAYLVATRAGEGAA